VQLEALARQVPPEILVLLVHKEQQDPPDLKEIPDRQALRVLLEIPDPREQQAIPDPLVQQAQPVPLEIPARRDRRARRAQLDHKVRLGPLGLRERPDQLALKAIQAQPVPLVRPGILAPQEQRAILVQ
jgi:hypothetical protein